MWKIIDNKTLKLELNKLENQVIKIAHFRDCTKINIVGKQMELETQKTSLKDSINELKGIVNKLCSEFTDFKVQTNARLDKHDERLDSIEKEIKKDIKKIDTKLNNVIKLNNLKV